MNPEIIAETILKAAGSSLRHYTPESKRRILEAAQAVLDAIKPRKVTER